MAILSFVLFGSMSHTLMSVFNIKLESHTHTHTNTHTHYIYIFLQDVKILFAFPRALNRE